MSYRVFRLSGKTYHGKMFIDASYVGDLMAAAGVTYTVGREPESQYVPYEALREKLEAAKQIVRPEAWKKPAAAKKPQPDKSVKKRVLPPA